MHQPPRGLFIPPHAPVRYFPGLDFVTFSLTSVRPDCVGAVLDSSRSLPSLPLSLSLSLSLSQAS